MRGETVRAFWHGDPLTPYQTLCLRSFVERGHAVEVFSYQPHLAVPDGVLRRDAAEIWPTDKVMLYQSGFGAGSPSLHSNVFRYAMLHRLGGWWIDLDIVLLSTQLPPEEMYFAHESVDLINVGVLGFPAGHDLMAAAVAECVRIGRAAVWAQTGPRLFTRLVAQHGLGSRAKTPETTYPVTWREIGMLFDPSRLQQVETKCSDATFLHLYNEIWRQSKIPTDLRPPEGSFLDGLVERHKVDFGTDRRIDYTSLARDLAWTRDIA